MDKKVSSEHNLMGAGERAVGIDVGCRSAERRESIRVIDKSDDQGYAEVAQWRPTRPRRMLRRFWTKNGPIFGPIFSPFLGPEARESGPSTLGDRLFIK